MEMSKWEQRYRELSEVTKNLRVSLERAEAALRKIAEDYPDVPYEELLEAGDE